MLYKELYYRHIFARVPNGPSTKQRFGSFYNYCDLFNYIFSMKVNLLSLTVINSLISL